MKDKKLIVLYVLMLIVGLALLFTKSTPKSVVEQPTLPKIEIKEVPKPKTEKITVALAKRDIDSKTILTKDHYYFKTLEVSVDTDEKAKYVTNAAEVDSYVAKNHIAADTILQRDFIVSPTSSEYVLLSLKEGSYMFPFTLTQIDSYLLNNLKSGDLVDIYVLYGAEAVTSRNSKEDKFVSPSRDFVTNRIKPIVVGKKIIFIESSVDENLKLKDKNIGQIQLELSNKEIKLLRTLMTNSTVIIYPSNYKENFEDGLRLLSDKERDWPFSDKDIFSGTQINKLKGN